MGGFMSHSGNRSIAGNEYMVNGDSIHKTWQYAWPKTIARAWNIENSLITAKYLDEKEVNAEGEEGSFYLYLRTLIDKTLEHPDLAIEEFEKILPPNSKQDLVKKYFPNKTSYKEPNYRHLFLRHLLDVTPIEFLKSFYESLLNKKIPGKVSAPEIDSHDFLWYKKLLCHKSEMVLDALKDEGFIVTAMENPPVHFDRNCSTRIIIRKANQPYSVTPKRSPCEVYKKEYRSTPQVSVSYEPAVGTSEKPTSGLPQQKEFNENLERVFPGLGTTFFGSSETYNGCRANGWTNTNGNGHVLVITLPKPPKNPSEFGLAIADYEAAGKIYSFTCCT
jgi:hypothetical protein